MSVVVEIVNTENLRRVKEILGAKNDAEAVERSIEKAIRDHELVGRNVAEHISHDLPEADWDELFSRPMISSGIVDAALRKERE